MLRRRSLIHDIYDRLSRAAGPRHWWPGDTTDEIIIGAVLTQNTAWRNVEKAIASLKSHSLCTLGTIARRSPAEIAPLIRASGYYNLKAVRLHSVATFFHERPGLIQKGGGKPSTPSLRNDLLAVKGVGRETADSILLYALNRLTFVVDSYTIRILSRHGLCAPNASYEEVRALLQSLAKPSVRHYNEFHALLVWAGHHYCKPTPRCDKCPLFGAECFATKKAWKNMRDQLKEGPPRPPH